MRTLMIDLLMIKKKKLLNDFPWTSLESCKRTLLPSLSLNDCNYNFLWSNRWLWEREQKRVLQDLSFTGTNTHWWAQKRFFFHQWSVFDREGKKRCETVSDLKSKSSLDGAQDQWLAVIKRIKREKDRPTIWAPIKRRLPRSGQLSRARRAASFSSFNPAFNSIFILIKNAGFIKEEND